MWRCDQTHRNRPRPLSADSSTSTRSRTGTSTDVVRKVKSLTRVKKIGHGGTLDPIATGVLPLCLGPATRFADSILLGTKAYRLTVTLGTATDTYDSEGETVAESDPSVIDRDEVDRALPAFRGTITQVPPMYSAVKHNGQRLYKLARAGVEVERKSRQVEVAHLEITRWSPPEFDLELVCGHGFYARSLANDLGRSPRRGRPSFCAATDAGRQVRSGGNNHDWRVGNGPRKRRMAGFPVSS